MRIFYIFFFFLIWFHVDAQTTYTSASLPTIGDTLFTGIDNNPNNVILGSSGANQIWDFSDIDISFVTETVLRDVSELPDTSRIVGADMYVEQPGDGGIFYQIDGSDIYEIGRTGLDPIVGFLPLQIRYDDELTFRKTPLDFGDSYDDEYSFSVTVSGELIPDTLLSGLPIVPDSVRINVEVENEYMIDAWGTVMMPDGDYEALREEVMTYTNTTIEALTFLGWLELDPELLGALGEFLGEQETVSYRFWADGVKEALAQINIDEDGIVTRAEFRSRDITSSTIVVKADARDVVLYPNPTFGMSYFNLVNFDAGNYRLIINNILGKSMFERSYQLGPNGVIEEHLGFLSKGTYIYSIVDEKGNKVVTKRIVILNP